MKNALFFAMLSFAPLASFGEIQIINGVKYECTEDGLCVMVDDENGLNASDARDLLSSDAPRILMGYVKPTEFLSFLRGEEGVSAAPSGLSLWVFVLAVLVGLAMNLSPCVLPMVPVNLMIIGKSTARGLLYGLGMAAAYGTMGLLAAAGSFVFGELQSSPWFNLAVAVVFFALALSLMGVFFIDFSRLRGSFAAKKSALAPSLFAFVMGAASAILAGACVAPLLIAVLTLTADLVSSGHKAATLLPFAVGVGMALPWPFIAAGLKLLPRPGDWMGKVEKAFGVFVLALAAYYGLLAWKGFAPVDRGDSIQPSQLMAALENSGRPVLVDCWASWCKNCAAMEKFTLRNSDVVKELEDYTVIRVQAEDLRELVKLPGLESIKGLPAILVYE